jgi:cytidylate kinase
VTLEGQVSWRFQRNAAERAVRNLAGELGVRTQLLESLDERQTNWLQELFEALFGGQAVSETAYVHHLARTLFGLAAHGECVVVGHGGAQILPPATTLRVRLVGPRQDRIAAARRQFGWSYEEAEQWIERVDQERNAFIKGHFHKDPADPDQYDLCLNVFRFSAAQCVEHIVTALRQSQAAVAQACPAGSAGSGGMACPS